MSQKTFQKHSCITIKQQERITSLFLLFFFIDLACFYKIYACQCQNVLTLFGGFSFFFLGWRAFSFLSLDFALFCAVALVFCKNKSCNKFVYTWTQCPKTSSCLYSLLIPLMLQYFPLHVNTLKLSFLTPLFFFNVAVDILFWVNWLFDQMAKFSQCSKHLHVSTVD